MGDYLRGCIQISNVANKKFIEELEAGYGYPSVLGNRDWIRPYHLSSDGEYFEVPYFGFLTKYGLMGSAKKWLIDLSNKNNSWIMVTMTYEDQFFDAFTNIPKLDPNATTGWGYYGPSDRETNDRAELRKSLEIKFK